jgi:hypothetical protein
MSNTTKAILSFHSDVARREKAKDKDRACEEKKVLQADKEAMKSVRAKCKDSTSPGLLAYCGAMVADVTRYSGAAALKAATKDADFDPAIPYIVDVGTAFNDLLDAALVKGQLLNFRAQLPHSDLVGKRKKVPVHACSLNTNLWTEGKGGEGHLHWVAFMSLFAATFLSQPT